MRNFVTVGARALARRLGRDRSGVSALEFAIVSLPCLMMFFFIVNVGIQLFTQATLDAAVAAAARQIRIGLQRGTSDADVRSLMCGQMAGTAVNCSALSIYVTSGATFGALTPASVTGAGLSKTGFTPGATGDYVLLQVAYPTAAPLPLALTAATFLSSAVFRNEL